MDSDLSSGVHYPAFDQPGPKGYNGTCNQFKYNNHLILSGLRGILNKYSLSHRDPLSINRKARATCWTEKKNHLIPLKNNGGKRKKSTNDPQVKIL